MKTILLMILLFSLLGINNLSFAECKENVDTSDPKICKGALQKLKKAKNMALKAKGEKKKVIDARIKCIQKTLKECKEKKG